MQNNDLFENELNEELERAAAAAAAAAAEAEDDEDEVDIPTFGRIGVFGDPEAEWSDDTGKAADCIGPTGTHGSIADQIRKLDEIETGIDVAEYACRGLCINGTMVTNACDDGLTYYETIELAIAAFLQTEEADDYEGIDGDDHDETFGVALIQGEETGEIYYSVGWYSSSRSSYIPCSYNALFGCGDYLDAENFSNYVDPRNITPELIEWVKEYGFD